MCIKYLKAKKENFTNYRFNVLPSETQGLTCTVIL